MRLLSTIMILIHFLWSDLTKYFVYFIVAYKIAGHYGFEISPSIFNLNNVPWKILTT